MDKRKNEKTNTRTSVRTYIGVKQFGALCLAGAILFGTWGCNTTSENITSGSESGSDTGSVVSEGIEEVYTAKENIDENQVDKAEIVYAKADADGSVQEVTVETILKNNGGLDDITDVSSLTDIRNTEGDEAYTRNGNQLVWENHGEDISYKGTSSDALPVSVSVSYELDGAKIEPQELIGKSGHVKIRFDYENHLKETVTVNGTEYEVPVPFVFLSAVTLDEEKFVNVEVNQGEVLSVNGAMFVVGYALPGVQEALGLSGFEMTEDMNIPEYVELEADVTDFELEFTETIVVNGFFENLDEEDFTDVRESGDSMEELSDASDSIVSGTQTLYDQMVLYQGYLNQYFNGVNELQSGTESLETAMGTLSEQGENLNQGVQTWNQGMTAYADSYQETMAVVEQYGDELPPEVMAALEQLGSSADALAESSNQVADGVTAYTSGVTQAYGAVTTINSGAKQLADSGVQLQEGMSGLVTGTNTLLNGIQTFDSDGIEELAKLFGEDLQAVLDKAEALKKADESYMNYGGIAEGRTGYVVFMIETEELTK